jgi:hypothetical protein
MIPVESLAFLAKWLVDQHRSTQVHESRRHTMVGRDRGVSSMHHVEDKAKDLHRKYCRGVSDGCPNSLRCPIMLATRTINNGCSEKQKNNRVRDYDMRR